MDRISGSNGFPVLNHAGEVSHAQMELEINALYVDDDQLHKQQDALHADRQDDADLRALEKTFKRRLKK